MNRRQFLASLGIGAPAAVLAAKLPKLEAKAQPHPFNNRGASSGVCQDCGGIAPEHTQFVTDTKAVDDLSFDDEIAAHEEGCPQRTQLELLARTPMPMGRGCAIAPCTCKRFS